MLAVIVLPSLAANDQIDFLNFALVEMTPNGQYTVIGQAPNDGGMYTTSMQFFLTGDGSLSATRLDGDRQIPCTISWTWEVADKSGWMDVSFTLDGYSFQGSYLVTVDSFRSSVMLSGTLDWPDEYGEGLGVEALFPAYLTASDL